MAGDFDPRSILALAICPWHGPIQNCDGAHDQGWDDGLSVRRLVLESYKNSKEHGFWDDMEPLGPNEQKYVFSTKLALIHSEVSEALEEIRDVADLTEIRYTESGKPEGFGPELADIVIRVADLAGAAGIDLEAVIVEKQAYNRGRPFMHGRTI